MGQAIGQILPTAVGVAISPLPIVAVVLMLVTPRGRTNGPAFIVGWCAGLAVVGAIVISAAGSAGATDDGAPATWVSWLKLILGVLLLLVAARQWKARPVGSEEPATPKWMGALDGFTAVKALGAGVALSALNPKTCSWRSPAPPSLRRPSSPPVRRRSRGWSSSCSPRLESPRRS